MKTDLLQIRAAASRLPNSAGVAAALAELTQATAACSQRATASTRVAWFLSVACSWGRALASFVMRFDAGPAPRGSSSERNTSQGVGRRHSSLTSARSAGDIAGVAFASRLPRRRVRDFRPAKPQGPALLAKWSAGRRNTFARLRRGLLSDGSSCSGSSLGGYAQLCIQHALMHGPVAMSVAVGGVGALTLAPCTSFGDRIPPRSFGTWMKTRLRGHRSEARACTARRIRARVARGRLGALAAKWAGRSHDVGHRIACTGRVGLWA